jgi:hypothetical protein
MALLRAENWKFEVLNCNNLTLNSTPSVSWKENSEFKDISEQLPS